MCNIISCYISYIKLFRSDQMSRRDCACMQLQPSRGARKKKRKASGKRTPTTDGKSGTDSVLPSESSSAHICGPRR